MSSIQYGSGLNNHNIFQMVNDAVWIVVFSYNLCIIFQIHETVENINQLKTSRDFFLGFSKDPQEFINNWLVSQSRDLKVSDDVRSIVLGSPIKHFLTIFTKIRMPFLIIIEPRSVKPMCRALERLVSWCSNWQES